MSPTVASGLPGRSAASGDHQSRRISRDCTAAGIGAALSQTIAGTIVHHFNLNAGFLFLAAIAAAAFGILYFFMSETRDKNFLNGTP
jgi:sugar phosphate permease